MRRIKALPRITAHPWCPISHSNYPTASSLNKIACTLIDYLLMRVLEQQRVSAIFELLIKSCNTSQLCLPSTCTHDLLSGSRVSSTSKNPHIVYSTLIVEACSLNSDRPEKKVPVLKVSSVPVAMCAWQQLLVMMQCKVKLAPSVHHQRVGISYLFISQRCVAYAQFSHSFSVSLLGHKYSQTLSLLFSHLKPNSNSNQASSITTLFQRFQSHIRYPSARRHERRLLLLKLRFFVHPQLRKLLLLLCMSLLFP